MPERHAGGPNRKRRTKGKRIGSLWWEPFAGYGDATLTPTYESMSTIEQADALQDAMGVLQSEYDVVLGDYIRELQEIVDPGAEHEDVDEGFTGRHWEEIASAPRDGRQIIFAQPGMPPFWLVGRARPLDIPAGAWQADNGELVWPTFWLPVLRSGKVE